MPTLLVAITALLASAGVAGQPPRILRVTVTLTDASGHPMPVPHHALLVSDQPPSDAPRLVFTGLDGTVEIRLRPGAYIVESDRPVAFEGRLYRWTHPVEIGGDSDATLALTSANAEVDVAPAGTEPGAPETDLAFLLPRWQDSVVAIWTPTARLSGFVADAAGLVVTSRAALGEATPVAVQLSPAVKVPARVLMADPTRPVAVLWVDPASAASTDPVPLECRVPQVVPIVDGNELFTIGNALRGLKDLVVGSARVSPDGLMADFDLEYGSDGGPVFTPAGRLVGLATRADAANESISSGVRVISTREICDALTMAAKMREGREPPAGVRLPVEPQRPLAREALEAAAPQRLGSLAAYQASAQDFDVTFVTPAVAYAAQRWLDQERTGGGVSPEMAWERERLLTDFGTWTPYFRDLRPVLLIRVTPKLAEGFWTKVARGAASTQGISLPPFKRRKPGFAGMRVFCGQAEVTPVQPFITDARAAAGDAVREGLYVFGPEALGPHCGQVRLALSSEKSPDRADTVVVDSKVIDKVWQDFAVYRNEDVAPGPLR